MYCTWHSFPREDKASLASLRQTSLAIAKIERVMEGEVTTDTAGTGVDCAGRWIRK